MYSRADAVFGDGGGGGGVGTEVDGWVGGKFYCDGINNHLQFCSRYVYPEFLPSTMWYHRDKILERLERQDMYRRRHVIHIPEFYVGETCCFRYNCVPFWPKLK